MSDDRFDTSNDIDKTRVSVIQIDLSYTTVSCYHSLLLRVLRTGNTFLMQNIP